MSGVIQAPSTHLCCRELTEILVDWLGGDLNPAAAEALEWHCARCPDCDHLRATYLETIALAEHLFSRSLSEEQHQALEARLLEELRADRG